MARALRGNTTLSGRGLTGGFFFGGAGIVAAEFEECDHNWYATAEPRASRTARISVAGQRRFDCCPRRGARMIGALESKANAVSSGTVGVCGARSWNDRGGLASLLAAGGDDGPCLT